MANSHFPSGGGGTVTVDAGLTGDGSSGSPLDVVVDGVTIVINGSNELTATTGGSGDVVGPTGASDARVVLFDGTSGKLIKEASAQTGTGVPVFSTSPSLTTPVLGTPTSGTLTNCTIPVGGVTGLGTGVATALAINVGTAGAPVVLNGALGTPSSGTATNLTGTAAGLTAGTASAVSVGGITGLGTGVGTFLATPTSANLASAVTDETGSGALVFATSPTLTTPVLGVASGTSLTLSGNMVLGIPASDVSSIGRTLASQNAGATITAMDLVYLDSSATWQQADADAASTSSGLLAVSLQGKTSGQAMNVALPGSIVRNDAWNWTPGVPLYVSPTAAAITATAPSTSGQIIRVVGWAITADVIFFDPSPDYLTHA